MIELLKEITAILRGIYPETYHEINRKDPVAYPYAVFGFDTENIERNQEGFYIDLDIFDANASYTDIFQLEEEFKDGLIFRRELSPDFNFIFSFLGSNKVPTADENIKRRTLRFYVKVDWRNK